MDLGFTDMQTTLVSRLPNEYILKAQKQLEEILLGQDYDFRFTFDNVEEQWILRYEIELPDRVDFIVDGDQDEYNSENEEQEEELFNKNEQGECERERDEGSCKCAPICHCLPCKCNLGQTPRDIFMDEVIDTCEIMEESF